MDRGQEQSLCCVTLKASGHTSRGYFVGFHEKFDKIHAKHFTALRSVQQMVAIC